MKGAPVTKRIYLYLSVMVLWALLAWGGLAILPSLWFQPGEATAQQSPLLGAGETMSDTLTLLYWQAPSIANPYLLGGTKDRDAAAPVLEPLANYDDLGQLIPRLALSIPLTTNGGIAEDGSMITWTLRSGVLQQLEPARLDASTA